jgi:hypothetical protein
MPGFVLCGPESFGIKKVELVLKPQVRFDSKASI